MSEAKEEFSPLLPSSGLKRRKPEPKVKPVEDELALMRQEALSPIYGLDEQDVMEARSSKALLRLILPEKIVIFENEWQAKAKTVCTIEGDPQKGMTPFYVIACWGHIKIFEALIALGKYNKQQIREAMTTSVAAGLHRGVTPLYSVFAYGRYDIWERVQRVGEYTKAELRNLMDQPLGSQARDYGFTPFYAMATHGGAGENSAVGESKPVENSAQEQGFSKLYVMGGYTKSTWRDTVKRPLTSGAAAGSTPLYVAAECNRPGAIKSMRILGEYTQDEWLREISTPMTTGNDKGWAPVDIAALNKQEEALDEMRRGLSQEQWARLLNTRQVCYIDRNDKSQRKTLLEIVPERCKPVITEVKSESRSARADSSSSSDSGFSFSSGSTASTPPSTPPRLSVGGSPPSSGKNSPQSAASAYKGAGLLAEKPPVVLDLGAGATKPSAQPGRG